VEGRPEGLGQPACGLRGRLVAEARGCREILLDRIDVAVELHCDINMTSFMLSVKVNFNIASMQGFSGPVVRDTKGRAGPDPGGR
jgi:hypothetical protein